MTPPPINSVIYYIYFIVKKKKRSRFGTNIKIDEFGGQIARSPSIASYKFVSRFAASARRWKRAEKGERGRGLSPFLFFLPPPSALSSRYLSGNLHHVWAEVVSRIEHDFETSRVRPQWGGVGREGDITARSLQSPCETVIDRCSYPCFRSVNSNDWIVDEFCDWTKREKRKKGRNSSRKKVIWKMILKSTRDGKTIFARQSSIVSLRTVYAQSLPSKWFSAVLFSREGVCMFNLAF